MNPSSDPPTNIFGFRKHWTAFLQTLPNSVWKNVEVREVKKGDTRLIAFSLPNVYKNADTLKTLYGAQSISSNLFNEGRRLSQEDLFKRLLWYRDSSEIALHPITRLPHRLLILIPNLDSKAKLFSEIREAIYDNSPGARNILVSIAFQRLTEAEKYDGVVFVNQLHTPRLRTWLERADRNQSEIVLYHPYELVDMHKQASDSRGVWLPYNLHSKDNWALPYVPFFAESLCQNGEALLADVSNNQQVKITKISGFEKLYYWVSRFELENAPVGPGTYTSSSPIELRNLRPFQLKITLQKQEPINLSLTLKEDPDVREDLQRRRLQIREQIKIVDEEKKHLRYLDRVAADEGAENSQTNHASSLPLRSVYLFFEKHSGYSEHKSNFLAEWQKLSRLIQNASLGQLRKLRYVFCSFSMPRLANQTSENRDWDIKLHIIIPENKTTVIPPGLDAINEQHVYDRDSEWAKLGYNLYTPRYSILAPSVRPEKTRRPPERRLEDEQIFNDLLRRAIYSSPKMNSAEFYNTGNLCLIYRDVVDPNLLVPIFIHKDEGEPLSDVAFEHLNQVGLTLLEQVDINKFTESEFLRQVKSTSVKLAEQADLIADDIKNKISEEILEQLDKKDKKLQREKDELQKITSSVDASIKNAEELRKNLSQRKRDIDHIAQDAKQNWQTFKQYVADVDEELNIKISTVTKSSDPQSNTRTHNLRRLYSDAFKQMRDRFANLYEQIKSLEDEFGGRTQYVARILEELSKSQSIIRSETIRTVPESARLLQQESAIVISELKKEVVSVRQELEIKKRDIRQLENEMRRRRDTKDGETRWRELLAQKDVENKGLLAEIGKLKDDLHKQIAAYRVTAQERKELDKKIRSSERIIQDRTDQNRLLEKKLQQFHKQIINDPDNETVKESLLDLLDNANLNGAISHAKQAKKAEEFPAFALGLEQIAAKIASYMSRRYLLKRIEIQEGHTAFDHNLHDAIGEANDENLPDNMIVKVLRDGYVRAKDNKVWLPASVVVNVVSAPNA